MATTESTPPVALANAEATQSGSRSDVEVKPNRSGSKRKADSKVEGSIELDRASSDNSKKRRFVWPDVLHAKFVSAVFDVGLRCSSAQTIAATLAPPGTDVVSVERLLAGYRAKRGVPGRGVPVAVRSPATVNDFTSKGQQLTDVDEASLTASTSTRIQAKTALLQNAEDAELNSHGINGEVTIDSASRPTPTESITETAELPDAVSEVFARSVAVAGRQVEIALQSDELLRRFQCRLRAILERQRNIVSTLKNTSRIGTSPYRNDDVDKPRSCNETARTKLKVQEHDFPHPSAHVEQENFHDHPLHADMQRLKPEMAEDVEFPSLHQLSAHSAAAHNFPAQKSSRKSTAQTIAILPEIALQSHDGRQPLACTASSQLPGKQSRTVKATTYSRAQMSPRQTVSRQPSCHVFSRRNKFDSTFESSDAVTTGAMGMLAMSCNENGRTPQSNGNLSQPLNLPSASHPGGISSMPMNNRADIRQSEIERTSHQDMESHMSLHREMMSRKNHLTMMFETDEIASPPIPSLDLNGPWNFEPDMAAELFRFLAD